MSSHWNEEDDDEIEEGDDEYVEQVCDVVCRTLQVYYFIR